MKKGDLDSFEIKKSLGQNFLKDQIILEKIVNEISFDKNLSLVEFGIGLGDLTKMLLKKSELICYEIDLELIKLARHTFKNELSLNLLDLRHKDILKFESKKESLSEKGFFLVSNLPYYIASRVILNMLSDPSCKGFVVMTQKEIAHKFCAVCKDSNFCALSVIIQSVGEVEFCFDVDKSCFYPEPKVMSSVFKFSRKNNFLDSKFLEFLKVCFSQPRKKLISNLKKYKNVNLELVFSDLNLEHNLRPHELNTKQYISLFERVNTKDDDGKSEKYVKQQ